MPFIDIETNLGLKQDEITLLLENITDAAAKTLEKPLKRIMTSYKIASMLLGKEKRDICFVTVRHIGIFQNESKRAFCCGLTSIVHNMVQNSQVNIYFLFQELQPEHAWQTIDSVLTCAGDK